MTFAAIGSEKETEGLFQLLGHFILTGCRGQWQGNSITVLEIFHTWVTLGWDLQGQALQEGQRFNRVWKKKRLRISQCHGEMLKDTRLMHFCCPKPQVTSGGWLRNRKICGELGKKSGVQINLAAGR